jgi:hypothetical protein
MWEIGDIVYRVYDGIFSIHKIIEIRECISIPYVMVTIEDCLTGNEAITYLSKDKQSVMLFSNITYTSDIEYVKQLINN